MFVCHVKNLIKVSWMSALSCGQLAMDIWTANNSLWTVHLQWTLFLLQLGCFSFYWLVDVWIHQVFRHDFLLMPRKSIKTEKPPLLFLERPVGGARFKNGPEVRAAHNPKGFFSETQAHKSFNSWVRCLLYFLLKGHWVCQRISSV